MLVQYDVFFDEVADELGGFEPLLANAGLAVELPYFGTLVKNKDISVCETCALWFCLDDGRLGVADADFVQFQGGRRTGFCRDVVEPRCDPTMEADQVRKV